MSQLGTVPNWDKWDNLGQCFQNSAKYMPKQRYEEYDIFKKKFKGRKIDGKRIYRECFKSNEI